MDRAMNRLSPYRRTRKDDRRMGVVTVWGAMHGPDRPLVEQEPVGFLNDVDIARAGNVEVAPDRLQKRGPLLSSQHAYR